MALEAVRALAQDGARVAGLFAVGLTTAVGRRPGRPPEWRELLRGLRGLRRHAETEVRDAALVAVTHHE
ncbi:hypothetical protein OV450_6470 [Actinobacteria bacterium OV450]|nr:hypothetical protein OV450_6470 [Actinobacteria bacterium OV450]